MRATLLGLCTVALSLPAAAGEIHVDADAAPGGDGTRARPHASLAAAEAASAPGDRIVVGRSAACLDGGIVLKCGQRLEGDDAGDPPCITNGGGDAVTLAAGVRVAGLRIERAAGSAVIGVDLHAQGAGCGRAGAELHQLRIADANLSGGITGAAADIYGPLSHSGITIIEASGPTRVAIARVTIDHPRGNGLALFAEGAGRIDATVERTDILGQDGHGVDTALLAYAQGPLASVELVFAQGSVVGAGVPPPDAAGGGGLVCGADFGAAARCVVDASRIADAGHDNVLGIIASDAGAVDIALTGSLLEGATTNLELVSWGLAGSSLEARLGAEVASSVLRDSGEGNFLVTENGEAASGTFEVRMQDSQLTGGGAGFWVQSIPTRNRRLRSVHAIDLGGGPLGSPGGNRIVDNEWADLLVDGPVHVDARHGCVGTVVLNPVWRELGSVDTSGSTCPP